MDELLSYYHRELAFIRNLGAEFAAAHPKIAGRLRLSKDGSEDPHVSRMIEAFALLAARIRRKLDDEFPEITQGLLNILYPHYLAPIPSCAIVRSSLDSSQAELIDGYHVPAGATIETEPIEGLPVRFRTVYDVHLWPVRLAEATYRGQPFAAPALPLSDEVQSVVRLRLECFSRKLKIAQLPLERLRFYLAGQVRHVHLLYELLLNHCVAVAVAADPRSAAAVLADPAIVPVGFERHEGLLPYPARSFLGYRLLTEYFTFSEKFLFVDLQGITPAVLARVGQQSHLEIYIYCNRHLVELEQQVSAETFQLGSTPAVNLYSQRAEPLVWRHTQREQRIVPDARRPAAHEIWSVDRVVATTSGNEQIEFAPFHSAQHVLGDQRSARAYWYAHRRPAHFAAGQVDRGTEVYLSLVDLDFQPARTGDWTLDIETTCLSRDLPGRPDFWAAAPTLRFATAGSLAKLQFLTQPTPTFRAGLSRDAFWRLISHLSLNHLSIIDQENGAHALREILKLYDPSDSESARAQIQSVLQTASRRTVARVGGPVSSGFCRGVEVTIQLDEDRFTGGGMFLFAQILDRFLGLYSSINSFTRTRVTTNRRTGLYYQGPPRAGEQILI